MTTAQIKYAAKRRNQNFKPVKPHDFKVGDFGIGEKSHILRLSREKYQDSHKVTR